MKLGTGRFEAAMESRDLSNVAMSFGRLFHALGLASAKARF